MSSSNICLIKSSVSDSTLTVSSCQASTNALTLKVQSTAASVSDNIIKIQVSDGIKNPPSVVTLAFSLYIYSSLLEVKDYNDSINISFTPGSLSKVNVSTASQNCGEITNLTFSFTANQPILKGGSIRLTLPSFTQDSGSNSIQTLITPNTGIRVNMV